MRVAVDYRRFGLALGAYAVLLAIGTIGFRLLLDEGWVTSLYRTVVTTTLTGEVTQPDTTAGEIFTIGVLLGGVAIFLYLAGAIAEMIALGVLGGTFAERKRRHMIERLEGHVIVCGYGRVGERVIDELTQAGAACVVIEILEDAASAAQEQGALVVHGDATEDADLEQAGLPRARALIATADSDEHNLFITLSARALRPDLMIVARASTAAAARKIRLAGASRVVQPYSTAGVHMANLVLKPQVADFLDVVTTGAGPLPDLRIEEILVSESCIACGKSIGELRIQTATGALIIGLRKRDGTFNVTPDGRAQIEDGDVLVGVGTVEEIVKLEALFAPHGPAGVVA